MIRVYDDCDFNLRNKEVFLSTEKSYLGQLMTSIRESTMASHRSRSARKYLRSHASIDYEKARQAKRHVFIIHPFSLFRHWWDTLMILMLTICLFAIPYQAAFKITQINHMPWIISKNCCLFFFCLDVIVNFMTGYFDKSQSMVELKSREIAKTYLKNGFVFDFVGSFPTDVFFLKRWNSQIVCRELASMLFIFRMPSLIKYSDRYAQDYDAPRTLYDFLTTIFWIIIILHWQACLYWIVPVAVVTWEHPQRPKEDSWINSLGLWEQEEGYANKYGYCILRAIATFMQSGFLARTEPRTIEDQYLAVLFHVISTLIFCFLVARVMEFFKGSNSSRLKYDSTLVHLAQYMSYKQLPQKTQKRVMTYHEVKYQRRFFKEREILSILSMHMRQEIRMHSCRKLVENVTFFNNLPPSILSRIVTLLQSEFFLVNDVIVKAKQTGNCMYFISSGTVAVYTSSGKEVCHLEDGAHFGEIALVMPDAKRVASVVAIENCKLYKLSRVDFVRTIHPYPMLWERIKKVAIERHEKTTILNAR